MKAVAPSPSVAATAGRVVIDHVDVEQTGRTKFAHGPRGTRDPKGNGPPPPSIWRPLLTWFTWYSRNYVRRHFHAVRVSRSGAAPPGPGQPLVFYVNHASWWDPLVGLLLKDRFFRERKLFVPIDARALDRYRLLSRLGFFGVDQQSSRGAVQFLRVSESLLTDPQALLAVTPQGRFVDVRERPVRFRGGLGHLASRVDAVLFQPVAVEYVFWEERLPEILVRFGDATSVTRSEGLQRSPEEWNAHFETRLDEAQRALAIESQQRDPQAFECLMRGGAGQGGVYDWARSLRALLTGKRFQREHSSL